MSPLRGFAILKTSDRTGFVETGIARQPLYAFILPLPDTRHLTPLLPQYIDILYAFHHPHRYYQIDKSPKPKYGIAFGAKLMTRATKYLAQRKISFEVRKYEHETKGAEYAARAIGFPLEQTIKTLVVDLDDKAHTLALMPGDKQLDLKRISKACSAKKAALADTATAERLTGYLVGGISPFGIRRKLPAVMDESLLAFRTVSINGGQRGIMLIMAPGDIVSVLDCGIFNLVRD